MSKPTELPSIPIQKCRHSDCGCSLGGNCCINCRLPECYWVKFDGMTTEDTRIAISVERQRKAESRNRRIRNTVALRPDLSKKELLDVLSERFLCSRRTIHRALQGGKS
jgi:hypothetical protein